MAPLLPERYSQPGEVRKELNHKIFVSRCVGETPSLMIQMRKKRIRLALHIGVAPVGTPDERMQCNLCVIVPGISRIDPELTFPLFQP